MTKEERAKIKREIDELIKKQVIDPSKKKRDEYSKQIEILRNKLIRM